MVGSTDSETAEHGWKRSETMALQLSIGNHSNSSPVDVNCASLGPAGFTVNRLFVRRLVIPTSHCALSIGSSAQ